MSGIELVAPAVAGAVGLGVRESYTHISGKIASSKNLDEFCDILVKDMQMLLAIKDDKEREVQRNKQKDTTSAYRLWTNMVTEVAGEVQKLRTKYEGKRLPWWRIQRRSRLSEEMAKKCNHVRELLKDGQSRDFLVDKPPERVLKELDVPQISGYPTLQLALENILGLLKNSNIKAIGVCGTKGVGKSTIMRNLNNDEEVAKLFDVVIFVRVSVDESNDHKLQEEIANRLMLDMEAIKDNRDEVARRIHTELESR